MKDPIREALAGQYGAALKMLRQAIERCPDDLWASGKQPRTFWRIAYHAIFYADLYLRQNVAEFKPWTHNEDDARDLWDGRPETVPYPKAELLDYIDRLQAEGPTVIDSLDLETTDPGFHWYKNISKLEHEILNIRHIQGHVGQLSELLMLHGIDTDWVSRVAPA
jgi:hypothetical protein